MRESRWFVSHRIPRGVGFFPRECRTYSRGEPNRKVITQNSRLEVVQIRFYMKRSISFEDECTVYRMISWNGHLWGGRFMWCGALLHLHVFWSNLNIFHDISNRHRFVGGSSSTSKSSSSKASKIFSTNFGSLICPHWVHFSLVDRFGVEQISHFQPESIVDLFNCIVLLREDLVRLLDECWHGIVLIRSIEIEFGRPRKLMRSIHQGSSNSRRNWLSIMYVTWFTLQNRVSHDRVHVWRQIRHEPHGHERIIQQSTTTMATV